MMETKQLSFGRQQENSNHSGLKKIVPLTMKKDYLKLEKLKGYLKLEKLEKLKKKKKKKKDYLKLKKLKLKLKKKNYLKLKEMKKVVYAARDIEGEQVPTFWTDGFSNWIPVHAM